MTDAERAGYAYLVRLQGPTGWAAPEYRARLRADRESEHPARGPRCIVGHERVGATRQVTR